jgi:low temperature requirement protein LtrA
VLRERGEDQVIHVTNMELFFDLVYVFAIIQLSNELFDHLSLRGAFETGVVFLAVWWVWNYTTWATNWLDPERRPVVVMMAILTAGSLVMASAIPDAFGHRGVTFAVSYVVLQVGRSAFMVWAFGPRTTMGRNYAQLLAWSTIAAVAWLAGAFVHDQDARLAIWAFAVLLDLGAPIHGYRLPHFGPTPMSDWTLAGGHLAERCQLVLMIAFGESILRLGEEFADARDHPWVVVAFGVGFVLAFSLWGVYFLHHADEGAETIEGAAEDAARIGRSAYAYAHAMMVGGVIVLAVAIHLAMKQPTYGVHPKFAACCLGGVGLYLAGLALFKFSLDQVAPRGSLLAIAALIVVGLATAPSLRLVELAAVAAVAVALLATTVFLRSS